MWTLLVTMRRAFLLDWKSLKPDSGTFKRNGKKESRHSKNRHLLKFCSKGEERNSKKKGSSKIVYIS